MTPFTRAIAGANTWTLMPNIALQPLVITTGQPEKQRALGLKRYELVDHLGNVRATLSDRNMAVWADEAFNAHRPQMLSKADYYAFGWNIPGRHYSSENYRFGFNGKENDNEVYGSTGTFQDYGMRGYDPRISRFISVDPLASRYPYISPYEFASNHPIKSTDLDGLEVEEEDNYERLERENELEREELDRSLRDSEPISEKQQRQMREQWEKDPEGELRKVNEEYEKSEENSRTRIQSQRAEQVENTQRTWRTQNFGKGQGTRTTELEGNSFRVKSEHSFDRAHETGDFANTNITRDDVENGIINDIVANDKMGVIPSASSDGSPIQPYEGEVNIDNITVGYRAVNVNGRIDISTYFPKTATENGPPATH